MSIDQNALLNEILTKTNKNSENIAVLLDRSNRAEKERIDTIKAGGLSGLIVSFLTAAAVKYLELYK